MSRPRVTIAGLMWSVLAVAVRDGGTRSHLLLMDPEVPKTRRVAAARVAGVAGGCLRSCRRGELGVSSPPGVLREMVRGSSPTDAWPR